MNAHDYLPYNSAHPKHCKDNLPYNLATCIIVFVSYDEKVEMTLKELKNWLKDCNYPDSVITQRTQTSVRRLQDVLNKSRRLTTKQDVVTTFGKRHRIYDVLKTSVLCV